MTAVQPIDADAFRCCLEYAWRSEPVASGYSYLRAMGCVYLVTLDESERSLRREFQLPKQPESERGEPVAFLNASYPVVTS